MKNLLRPAVALWLIFSLICAVLVSNSQFTADMSAFLPQNPSPRQQILIDQISEGFASRALIISIEGAPIPVLTRLSKNFSRRLQDGGNFSSVSNGQSTFSNNDNALLFANRYLLSPAMGLDRMSPNGLRAAISESLAEVGSSTGLFSKSLLSQDPTGESIEVIKRVVPSTQMLVVDGVWVNATQTRALLLAQTRAQGSDLDGQETAHRSLTANFMLAQSDVGAQADRAVLKFSGPGVFAVSSRDTIRTEAARLSALGTALILGLLWLIYRSVFALFLGIVPVVTGAIAGIAAVGLWFPAVHAMTLGFGITLMGEAVDYAIYLFVQQGPTSLNGKHAFSDSFWPTIRLGVLTSIFGFSALLFSGFTGLAQLGLFSIVGIITAALITRYVLPALLPHNFQIHQPVALNSFLIRAVQFLGRLKVIAVLITTVAFVTLAYRAGSLWGTELSGLSPVPQAAQDLDSELRAEMGASDAGLLIVIKADSNELALQFSEEITDRLKPLINAGMLNGFEAASNYLPSKRRQLERRASLPEDAELRRRLVTALQGQPLQIDKLEPFLVDTNRARAAAPLTRANFENTSMALGIDSLIMRSDRSPDQWTALIALQPPIKNGVPQTLNSTAIDNALADLPAPSKIATYVIDLKKEASDLYQVYLREAILLTGVGLLAIIGLLFAALRSVVRVVRVMVPLLAAIVMVAAGVVIFKGSLSLMHLVGMLLVVAVGSNYALFFDKPTTLRKGKIQDNVANNVLSSLFFANLTTITGFGLLAFSSVPVMNAIGSVVGAGAFLALILSAVFASTEADRASGSY